MTESYLLHMLAATLVFVLFESSPACALTVHHRPYYGRSIAYRYSTSTPRRLQLRSSPSSNSNVNNTKQPDPFRRKSKGKLLVLGGTGFWVITLPVGPSWRDILSPLFRGGGSRLRWAKHSGRQPTPALAVPDGVMDAMVVGTAGAAFRRAELKIDYRKGDARDATVIRNILNEGDTSA